MSAHANADHYYVPHGSHWPIVGSIGLFTTLASAALWLEDVSFGRMLFLSTVIGALCGFVGMYASYEAGVPSGTMIVLTGAALFCLALVVTGLKGLRRTAGMDEHISDAPVTARVGAPTA